MGCRKESMSTNLLPGVLRKCFKSAKCTPGPTERLVVSHMKLSASKDSTGGGGKRLSNWRATVLTEFSKYQELSPKTCA